jgi:hypothetical protein
MTESSPIGVRTKALEFFKDWSNYLLVTTVAALGWVAEHGSFSGVLKVLCVWSLALSIVFGIFTLALIPLVQEQREQDTKASSSNYEVRASFWGGRLRLMHVCFPQHVLFIIGIVLYALGTTLK